MTHKGKLLAQGFLSRIYKCRLEWEPESSELPCELVAKCPSTGEALEALEGLAEAAAAGKDVQEPDPMATIFVPTVHRNECAVYRLWTHFKPVPVPRVFFSQDIRPTQVGFLLMQDLSSSPPLLRLTGAESS